MARKVTSCEVAEHQPNQPIKLTEQASVRPAMVAAKSGITRETAQKQQQLATLLENSYTRILFESSAKEILLVVHSNVFLNIVLV